MPIHDWTRVDAGIFHDFHQEWIGAIKHALNRGILPDDYYALVEQQTSRYEPDVLTLQGSRDDDEDDLPDSSLGSGHGGVLAAPKLQPIAETDMAFYRRKQSTIAVRHVSGDTIVAIIEIVSPGNKAGRNPLRAFVEKAAQLLDQGIHLLIVDLVPSTKRDRGGIHDKIWREVAGRRYTFPAGERLTLAAYESNNGVVRAFVVHAAVGDALPEMPLFLEPDKAVEVPLETTYQMAYAEVPRRWRRVLEKTA
jgi:hypothetical protein